MVEGASKLFEDILQKMHSYQTIGDLTLKCSVIDLSTLGSIHNWGIKKKEKRLMDISKPLFTNNIYMKQIK
jgi:hypothetical protein